MSNLKLREVIKQIRQCKTAAEERAVISKESALIRNAFKSNKDEEAKHRNRNIAKLLFFNLLGYPHLLVNLSASSVSVALTSQRRE